MLVEGGGVPSAKRDVLVGLIRGTGWLRNNAAPNYWIYIRQLAALCRKPIFAPLCITDTFSCSSAQLSRFAFWSFWRSG